MNIGSQLAAAGGNPEHAAAIEDMLGQLLIVLIKRNGGTAAVPVAEIDDTGQDLLSFSVDESGVFNFTVSKKS